MLLLVSSAAASSLLVASSAWRSPCVARQRALSPRLAAEEGEPGGGGAYRTTTSGLKYIDTEVGSGEEATAGRVATIEFEGTLLDGDKILSSTKKDGKPLSFTVAGGDAPLWDEVVAGMRVGGKRRALVPPSNTLPQWDPLPDGRTGRFEIELTGIDVEGALERNFEEPPVNNRRRISSFLLAASFIPYFLPDELKPFGWRGKVSK